MDGERWAGAGARRTPWAALQEPSVARQQVPSSALSQVLPSSDLPFEGLPLAMASLYVRPLTLGHSASSSPRVLATDRPPRLANETITHFGFNSTADYYTIFEDVSKYNVQLNVLERLWAVSRNPHRL